MTVSRRDNIKWMLAAVPMVLTTAHARAQTHVMTEPELSQSPSILTEIAPWPVIAFPDIVASGYGSDPDLMNPKVTWPLTLSAQERALINVLGDLIIPPDGSVRGAGQIGIADFFDEWLSSPYSWQAGDRVLVLTGLRWLEAQCVISHAKSFLAASSTEQTAILDALMVMPVPDSLLQPAAFFERVRGLTVGGYFTVPEGRGVLGYIGDEPVVGDYPGPDAEALKHFNALLQRLGLTFSA